MLMMTLQLCSQGSTGSGGQTLRNLLHQKVPDGDKIVLFLSLSSEKN